MKPDVAKFVAKQNGKPDVLIQAKFKPKAVTKAPAKPAKKNVGVDQDKISTLLNSSKKRTEKIAELMITPPGGKHLVKMSDPVTKKAFKTLLDQNEDLLGKIEENVARDAKNGVVPKSVETKVDAVVEHNKALLSKIEDSMKADIESEFKDESASKAAKLVTKETHPNPKHAAPLAQAAASHGGNGASTQMIVLLILLVLAAVGAFAAGVGYYLGAYVYPKVAPSSFEKAAMETNAQEKVGLLDDSSDSDHESEEGTTTRKAPTNVHGQVQVNDGTGQVTDTIPSDI